MSSKTTKRDMLRKLRRAKRILNLTIRRMLDINKAQKNATKTQHELPQQENLREELKILNKIADQQAQLVRVYESQLLVEER